MSNNANRLPHEVRGQRGSSTAPSAPRTESKPASDAAIAERAYAKYEARGRIHGFDLEDWAEASHELLGSPSDYVSSPSHSPSRNPSLAIVSPRE